MVEGHNQNVRNIIHTRVKTNEMISFGYIFTIAELCDWTDASEYGSYIKLSN